MHEQKMTIQEFRGFLGKRHLKLTFERQYLFEKVAALKGHFNADSLYDYLKRDKVRIARGTVYRTIPLLLESGVIQKSVGDGKREFFESQMHKEHHDHLLCLKCHKVIEFHSDEIEKFQEKICGNYDFEMAYHDHRIYGYCRQCHGKKG